MDRSAGVNHSGRAADHVPGAADTFRTIAEIDGDAAFIIDCATGSLLYLSPSVEHLLGFSLAAFRDQLAGGAAPSPLAALCAGLPERLRRYAAGDATRLRVVREFDVQVAGGQAVPVEVISTLMLDGAGVPTTLAGVMRDLSARRASEAEQQRFASMLNHEFRTPLSTIDGAIQRLEASVAKVDESTRQRYRKIAVAVDRLIGMLDEYLSPDRMAAIGSQRQPHSIAPRQLLEEAAAQVRCAGRQAELTVADLPAALRCDPAGLRLALKVLVDNALAYSPAHTPILLAGRRLPNGIELRVRDHGPGVAQEDAALIFDKFYRGSNATGLPGSGLGLYMARSVVEVHGGTLSLAESSPHGADFRIWLPARDTAGKIVASSEPNSDNQFEQAG